MYVCVVRIERWEYFKIWVSRFPRAAAAVSHPARFPQGRVGGRFRPPKSDFPPHSHVDGLESTIDPGFGIEGFYDGILGKHGSSWCQHGLTPRGCKRKAPISHA